MSEAMRTPSRGVAQPDAERAPCCCGGPAEAGAGGVTAPPIPDRSAEALADGSARWDLASHLRIWLVAVLGLALDLWSKHWAFTHLDPRPGHDLKVVSNLLHFQRMLNRGALFGLGKGWTPLFIAASIIALAFVFFLFIQSSRKRRSLHVALALVLAGALGNLYDRAFAIADVVTFSAGGVPETVVGKIRDGHGERWLVLDHWPAGPHLRTIDKASNPRVYEQGVVRDFMKIRLGPLEIWPWVFNVADMMLVAGVSLLLLNFWWDRRAERAAQSADGGTNTMTTVGG